MNTTNITNYKPKDFAEYKSNPSGRRNQRYGHSSADGMGTAKQSGAES